ncbi:hypothetical protein FIBSPDRAFT_754067 [Athelia psychrophila]|uniref:Tafazzin family protein n=1 Tax=Athelia psychrophila TaxID=1759441 RepID=A0A166BW74_9AGAM|nr:hypothetical protein FIBSPDRAFT_754067 [Fibularhizoctonia sp. CBS 109695]
MSVGPFTRPTLLSVSLLCKAFLNSPFCSVKVNGLPNLLHALDDQERASGRGVVTVCNHISTLDDPLTWGVLPTRLTLNHRTTRWALGASDVMFTNPVFSTFFRAGQVLETFRGQGIYQPAVDTAIEKLDQGGWVHLFGEGYISQASSFDKEHGATVLRRFKWGVGRILMETAVPPIVIPMWLTGFDQLMPEGRAFPWKYIPRLGVKLSVTFGKPLPPEDIQAALRAMGREELFGVSSPDRVREGVTREAIGMNLESEPRKRQIDHTRSMVTAVVQRAVEELGRCVSVGKS